jgi:flotillin
VGSVDLTGGAGRALWGASQGNQSDSRASKIEHPAVRQEHRLDLARLGRAGTEAEADATRAEGEATAAATLAVGQAEAEAMDKRAEAFAHYNDAAVLQMLIEVLPQIAREVVAPMSNIDQLTVISTDGAGALPRQVNDNVVQTLNMLKTSTGLALEALIKKSVGKAAEGSRLDLQAAPAVDGRG